MSLLFTPLQLRGTTFRNRVWVSPMCQYSSVDGHPTDWHLVHLGSFAVGGAGLVMQEATGVTAEGRISPQDAGIWLDSQAEAYARIVDFVHSQGAVAGIQLAHAGRKASTHRPWEGNGYVADGGWQTVAPSAIGYDGWPAPRALDTDELPELVEAFRVAARRALDAGFDVIELHAAHGYLLHEFLSPLSNHREDAYGGDLAGRSRLLLEVVEAIRVLTSGPLFVRVSATDWFEGGWDLEQTVALAAMLAERGVDLVDVSSGGLVPQQQIAPAPGYQVPLARAVRAVLPVSAVGMITEPEQAEAILAAGDADAVMLARELLRDPHWALRAAHTLGGEVRWPEQYLRAR